MSRVPPGAAAGASGKSGGEQRGIPLPYFLRRPRATGNPVEKRYRNRDRNRNGEARCYHQIEMKPQTIGRALGIGLRVAGRIASQRVAAGAQAAASQPAPAAAASTAQSRVASGVAAQAARGAARGLGGFLKPFRRVGGILWLEVTGVFFALPVVVFGPTLWHTRASYIQGPDHRTFLTSAIIVVVFL